MYRVGEVFLLQQRFLHKIGFMGKEELESWMVQWGLAAFTTGDCLVC